MKNTLPLLLALGLLSLGGCNPRSAPPPPPAAWDWERFPSGTRLLLAELPAQAAPARVAALQAPASGVLRLAPDLDPLRPLGAGTVWARIESPDTDVSARASERLTAELGKRERRFAGLERPALLAQLERELKAAGEAAAAAAFAEREPGLFTGAKPVLDPALKPALSASQLAGLAQSLRERRDLLTAGDPSAEPADLQALRRELEGLRRAGEERERQLQLATPFAGILSLASPDNGRPVTAGEPVALLADPSVLRLRVRAPGGLLAGAPAASLELEASLPGGGTVCAPYAASGFEAADRTVPVLWFDVTLAGQPLQPPGAAGIEVPGRIYLRLPAPARIVPKLLIARYDTQDALAGGWRDAIPRLFPGATLVAEGRTAVAIQPPTR